MTSPESPGRPDLVPGLRCERRAPSGQRVPADPFPVPVIAHQSATPQSYLSTPGRPS